MSNQHLDPTDGAILDALRDVQDESTPTNWALFGFVPKTARLKVIETGDTDVSDMLEAMSSGKLHFAYLRHEMSETWKYVLIAWCGEGVPANVKGFFPRQTEEMEAFLKRSNIIYSALISARQESDLEEAEIVKALNKTSTFIRARTKAEKPATKLSDVRNAYWQKQRQVDEETREYHAERARQKEADAKAFQQAEHEIKSARAREFLSAREAEREAEAAAFHQQEADRTARQQAYHQRQREEVLGRADRQRQEAVVETDAGASRAAPAPVTRGNAAARFQAACREPEPEPRPAPVARAPRAVPRPAPQPEPEPEPEQSSWGGEETYEEPAAAAAAETGTEEQYYGEEQGYEEPAAAAETGTEEQYYEEPAAEEQTYEEPAAEEQSYEEPAAETGGETAAPLQYRAIAAYEAAQEGDLWFNEGDIINVLDTSDPDGWWTGEIEGVTGTFPSNYVEPL